MHRAQTGTPIDKCMHLSRIAQVIATYIRTGRELGFIPYLIMSSFTREEAEYRLKWNGPLVCHWVPREYCKGRKSDSSLGISLLC